MSNFRTRFLKNRVARVIKPRVVQSHAVSVAFSRHSNSCASVNLNSVEPGQPFQTLGDGCAATHARIPANGRVAHSRESGRRVAEDVEDHKNVLFSMR